MVLMAAALEACGGDGGATKTATPAAVQTQAPQATATVAACPTAPAGPQFAEVFTGAATGQGQGVLTEVAAATSRCTDTVTFAFAGAGLPAYEVKYVQAAVSCGSGLPVTTAGSAQITLRFEPAVAHDEQGNPTVSAREQTPNFATVKQLKPWCDFEGVVGWVIGTEARYYTVTAAQSPSRIVVEVYH